MSIPGQRGSSASTPAGAPAATKAKATTTSAAKPAFVPDQTVTLPRQGGPAASPAFTPTAHDTLQATATAVVDEPNAHTGDTPQLRRARFDRPLGPGHYLPTYADPELERIVREAAETAREQARAEGYARGWAEGRAAAAKAGQEEAIRRSQTAQARERIEADRINSALSAAVSAARDVGSVNAPQWNEVADALLDATLELTRAVLQREVTATGGEVVEAVRIALRGIADGSPVIAVNPEDHETLLELAGSLPADVHLVPDRSVPRGAALARAGARQLLAHLPSALAAAEEVLRG